MECSRGPACVLERLPQAVLGFLSDLALPGDSKREKISFHPLHKQTGNRIKYKKVDAETGREVEADDIIKGYEVSKGGIHRFEPEELEAVALESKRVIEIDEFVPRRPISISFI